MPNVSPHKAYGRNSLSFSWRGLASTFTTCADWPDFRRCSSDPTRTPPASWVVIALAISWLLSHTLSGTALVLVWQRRLVDGHYLVVFMARTFRLRQEATGSAIGTVLSLLLSSRLHVRSLGAAQESGSDRMNSTPA